MSHMHSYIIILFMRMLLLFPCIALQEQCPSIGSLVIRNENAGRFAGAAFLI